MSTTLFIYLASKYKPSNTSIIVSTLQIIQLNLFIVVIPTVSEWVNCCNFYAIGKLGVGNCTCYCTPRVVGVRGNSFCILVNDSDYVPLQVIDEVVGNIVINNSAHGLALSITCIYIISFLNRKVNKKLRTS